MTPKETEVVVFTYVRLSDASSSHRSGYKATFDLEDDGDFQLFRDVTKRRKGHAGVRYQMFLVKEEVQFTMEFEVYFVGWTLSARGAKVKFELQSHEDFDTFRTMEPGEDVWTMLLVEIGDDEKPVDQAQRAFVESNVHGL